MTLKDISWLRLANQQVVNGRFNNPKELAGWMGALQAQDFAMVKWAIGLRLPGSDIKAVEKSISAGEIIRSHLLRPTWHFVSADDFHWILALSSPRIMSSLKYRQNSLGLTTATLLKSNAIIADVLEGKDAGRELLVEELSKGGILPGDNRISHILLWAELSGIICSGKSPGNKQTYALIKDRLPELRKVEKEKALGMLAIKYFRSHGPATIRDFAWWSGLTSRDIRISLENAGDELENVAVDNQPYWMARNNPDVSDENSASLLPAFDEFLISYSDRSAALTLIDHKKAVSRNGIFHPVVILKSQVAGLWRPVKSKDRIIVEISLFKNAKRNEKSAIEIAAGAYGDFLGKKTEIKYVTE